MTFDLGLNVTSNFWLLRKYLVFNEAVSVTEASLFSLREAPSCWLVLQREQKLALIVGEHLYQNTTTWVLRLWGENHGSSRNVCLPQVEKGLLLSLHTYGPPEELWALGPVLQAHTNARPCRCWDGISASQQARGLCLSTGQLQSWVPFALEINVIQGKL